MYVYNNEVTSQCQCSDTFMNEYHFQMIQLQLQIHTYVYEMQTCEVADGKVQNAKAI